MSEEELLAAFCGTMMPSFYRHVMDGGEPPEMSPDSAVADLLDTSARAEFFDWLSTELGVESPRFSFSLTRTLRDLFEMLSHIVKDPFREHVGKLVSTSRPKSVPARASAVAAAAPPAVSVAPRAASAGAVATSVASTAADADMPQLEPFRPAPPVAASSLPAVSAPPAAAPATASVPRSAEGLRGHAIFAALSLGRNDKLDEIVRCVSSWPAETVEGFVAAYSKLHM